ncbi:hypothetical protein, partial [Chitinimonas sp.]|uniref:hypothetical protein n=1 Tax=Chitinimonas sp. TaxID=1934313 RepID=UPI0035AF6EDC
MTRSPIALALGITLLAHGAVAASLPATPVKPVTETLFGTQIVDPYRWLEDMQSSEFKTWLKAQADFAGETLASIPGRAALAARLTELSNASTSVAGMSMAGQRAFYLKTEPGRNGRRLYVREADGSEQLLLDPDTLASTGAHYAIDWYAPAPNGQLIAVGVSQGGSEDSELRIYDLKARKWLSERIDRTGLNERGIGWQADGKRFFYNRLPAPDAKGQRERYNKSAVWMHTVGEPADKDQPLFGYGLDPARPFADPDIPSVQLSARSHYVLATVEHGDAKEHSFYIAPLAKLNGVATPWQQVVTPADGVHHAWMHGDTLYLLSFKDAPRGKLLALDLHKPD